MQFIERVWRDRTTVWRVARAALWPLEGAYRAVVASRAALYAAGIVHSKKSRIPVLSVGNLTVGGTGKTPVSSWLAARLSDRGAAPAIVLRGYGGDEPLVHARINPGLPVVIASNRLAGIEEAIALGADVAVLDDAFQHRRASRTADIVLVSADNWSDEIRLLPAGPWRESLEAIRRATLVIITAKIASDEEVERASRAIRDVAPKLDQATVRLRPGALQSVADASDARGLESLLGKRVLAVAAVADPEAFFAQLSALGSVVTKSPFADHHAFSAAEAANLAAAGRDVDMVVCTLKDAVKLRLLWPAGAPALWYVSLSVDVIDGLEAIDGILEGVLAARPFHTL
ncbi:MAG TPA: tetraacyldisaccharide 4'-kinase [Gemmatimonadaceae bacterium]|nr:tetraacyldisaccharide 4'-kinase [Gemmatimonadaceae bacterium]